MDYRIVRYSNLIIEIDAYLTAPIPKSPSPIEQIGLLFTFRERHSRHEVSANGDRRTIHQRDGVKIPLCDHQFPSEIFNNHSDESLFLYLSCSFESFREEIDAKLIAYALIERWIEIRAEANSRSESIVFPMTVNLTMCHNESRFEIDGGGREDCGMVPASGDSVGEMLKMFDLMEGGDEICAICLEEVKKKKKNGEFGLQMPCLHVFHGDCILEWLKKSHFCPICRFQMPVLRDHEDDY